MTKKKNRKTVMTKKRNRKTVMTKKRNLKTVMTKKKNRKTVIYSVKEIPLWNQINPLKSFCFIKNFDRNDLIKADLATTSIKIFNSNVDEDLPNDANPERWLSSLIKILTNFKSQLLSTQEFVKFESIYLNSLLYQSGALKKKIFIHWLKKVGKCLKRWLNLNLTEQVSSILQNFPQDFFFIQSMRLPSEHWLFDLLRKIIGGFFLMQQCINYCMEAAVYCRAHININNLLTHAFISLGIISRVRSLGLDLLNLVSATSDHLHPYIMGLLDVFPDPQFTSLPPNLRSILEDFTSKNHNELRSFSSASVPGGIKTVNSKRKKILETTEQDKIPHSDNDEKSEEDGFIPLITNQDGDDVGEVVSSEVYEKLKTKRPKANFAKRKKRKIK